jgi:eukaryotic-like serine/threonine-protein kinase
VASVSGGPPKLLTRRLDQRTATELAGTEGAMNPFFSRDGQWVGYWTGTELFKVPVNGGGAVRLAELSSMTGGSWDDDGNLVVGAGAPSSTGVLQLSSTGGAASPMLDLASGELFHTNPQILPGGKAMLFQKVGTPPGPGTDTIEVVSLADRSRRTLVRGVGSARYLESGHLVYTDKAKMFAMPFDLERLETRGTAVEVLDDVAYDSVANMAQYDVSRTGTLVYRRSGGSPMSTVEWIDSTGKHEPVVGKPGAYIGTPRVSPDGKRVALAIRDGANQDIWVYEPRRDSMTRLTFGGGTFVFPVWTRDGQHVVFGAMGSGLYSSRADGAGQPQALQQGPSIRLPTSVTRDGTRLVYFQPDGNPQLWTVPIERDGGGLKIGTPERFLTTKFSDEDAAFSPDGRWIAYASNESGKFEVYVRAFVPGAPAGSERWTISTSGGGFPAWLPNGRELLYLSGDQIMRVGYSISGNSFVAEKPRVWATNVRTDSGFDIAPDGGRVAVNARIATPGAQAGEHSVVFVLNFFDELRRRAPIDR